MRRRLTDEDIEQVVREVYAVHSLLFQVGFTPDDVFAACQNIVNADPPGVYATVVLRAQGKEFVYWIQALPTEDEQDRYERAWKEFAALQPSMDRGLLDVFVASTQALREFHLVVRALVKKGFVLSEGAIDKWSTPMEEALAEADESSLIVVPTAGDRLRWRSARRSQSS